MTISKFLMWAAALVIGAATLASCSKNDAPGTGTGEVRFTAGMTHQAVAAPVSRAAGTEWAANDEVGIFMVNNGGISVVDGAENRKYTVNANGATATFTASESEKIYYPMDGSAVNFIAYYPWKTGNTLGAAVHVEIETTQTTASQAEFDLLYAKADNNGSGYSKTTTGSVNLTFDHKLSKLVMNCKAGDGVSATDLTGMTVTIKGMNTQSTFDLSDGTFGTASTLADITPRTIIAGEVYDAIILPAGATLAKGDFYVEFTIKPGMANEETFTWTMDAGTDFVGGNEYVYTVTLDRTGVTATGTIDPWTTENRDPVTAE